MPTETSATWYPVCHLHTMLVFLLFEAVWKNGWSFWQTEIWEKTTPWYPKVYWQISVGHPKTTTSQHSNETPCSLLVLTLSPIWWVLCMNWLLLSYNMWITLSYNGIILIIHIIQTRKLVLEKWDNLLKVMAGNWQSRALTVHTTLDGLSVFLLFWLIFPCNLRPRDEGILEVMSCGFFCLFFRWLNWGSETEID
jgi:hypothetical protein